MRYYRIVITDPATGNIVTPPGFTPALLGGATYTSLVNGTTLTGAWNIELDIPVIDAATSQGFSSLRVWGITNAEISQANNLVGKNIQVFGGMARGLPLANPAQSGLLVSGIVYQCFGNNIGTARTLDFVISPGAATSSFSGGVGTLKSPLNFSLNWKGGQPLGPALKSALQTAFPGYTVNVNVSANIVRPAGDTPSGFYSTLEQMAQDVRAMSLSIVKTSGYTGVSIVCSGTTINAFDGTAANNNSPTQINFQDLIGQPTWIESPNIQLKTVMRADLTVGSQIMLPPTLITNTAQANSSLVNQQTSFQGGFTVISIRHVGDFRAPTGDAWVSVIEASPNIVTGTTAAAA
jgi:hypothetical protein